MKKKISSVALITGASRGLGAFLATEMARDGYAVVVHYRRGRTQALRLTRAIRQEGGMAEALAADLADSSQVEALIRRIRRKFGRLDVLINNAGTYRPIPVLRSRAEDWNEGLNSTATASFFTIRACLPLFPKSGGRILNMGDSACEKLTARRMAPGYHIGKVGVLLLTRFFAVPLIRRKITVNCISPGYLENSIDLPPARSLPGGRPIRFAEILAAVRYLCSPAADQVTGANLVISGGWNL